MKMQELLPSSSAPSGAPQTVCEFVLVCGLAGAQLTSEWRARVANCDCSALGWDEVLRLAEHHGVLPLVARNLAEFSRVESSGGPPPEIRRLLRSAYDSNLRRSLWFTAELTRIMRHFELHQVRAIPYKGPALAKSLYGDPGLRSFSDLDFLILPADFERAKLALAEIGYHPSTEFAAAVERFWLSTGYERAFDGSAGKNLVELQWALLPRFYGVDLDVGSLLARSGKMIVGEGEVPCLSPEDSLLALSLHAAKHLWTRLIWLSDISETLRTQAIDYSLLSSRARVLGVARILGVSFWLAKNVLRADLPQAAEDMIAADSQVSVLGSEFAARLAGGTTYDFESTEYFRLIMKLRERRGDRWRYLWRLVWTPGAGDLAAVRLPEGLFLLYRVVRIGRLMRKFV